MNRIISITLAIVVIIGFAAVTEYSFGRPLSYKYGPIELWSETINSNANSQQIADPYTFTHVIHGFAFYGLLSLVPGPLSLGTRATLTVAMESGWEVLENTDWVINKYREETISLDYYGDSIINSVFDIFACLVGFLIAARLRTRMTVLLFILIEVALTFWIRDNLTLNILMLLCPLKTVKVWQMGL
mgnify:CR=1 FL=1